MARIIIKQITELLNKSSHFDKEAANHWKKLFQTTEKGGFFERFLRRDQPYPLVLRQQSWAITSTKAAIIRATLNRLYVSPLVLSSNREFATALKKTKVKRIQVLPKNQLRSIAGRGKILELQYRTIGGELKRVLGFILGSAEVSRIASARENRRIEYLNVLSIPPALLQGLSVKLRANPKLLRTLKLSNPTNRGDRSSLANKVIDQGEFLIRRLRIENIQTVREIVL